MRLILFLAGTLALGGCGPAVDAPPLTVRSVEGRPVPLPAEASEPSSPVDASLAPALAAQVAAAETGDRRFIALRAEAERTIAAAAGAAAGSERWTVAQQALTALVAARAPVRDASVAVEALRQAPANAGPAARQAVETAAARIEGLDDAEATTVAALTGRLG